MPELVPHLPEGSTILFNHLSDEETPSQTIEDLFAVTLPGPHREYIDVGWYAEADGTGEYVVQVFAEGSDEPLEPPLAIRDVHHAVRVIELLAVEYTQAPAAV